MPTEVNSQVVDAVNIANYTMLANTPTATQGFLSGAASYSISLLMLNAVSAQFSGAQIAEATVVTSCAGILKAVAKAVG